MQPVDQFSKTIARLERLVRAQEKKARRIASAQMRERAAKVADDMEAIYSPRSIAAAIRALPVE